MKSGIIPSVNYFSMIISLTLCASSALAQGYPNKPIRLMIGYTAGGSAKPL